MSPVCWLQVKHWQVEWASGAKLHNVNTTLSQEKRMMGEKLKSTEMEYDDVAHGKKLLLKSIQVFRLKTHL